MGETDQQSPDVGAKVAELLDRAAITEVLYRYYRGVDRRDEALVRECYTPDAIDDHGIWKGSGKEFAAVTVNLLTERFDSTHHALSNILIEFDGDTAWVETYVTAAHQRIDAEEGQQLWMFGGGLIDRFERRAGVWLIAHRRVLNDWSSWGSVADHPLGESFAKGRADRNDIVFER